MMPVPLAFGISMGVPEPHADPDKNRRTVTETVFESDHTYGWELPAGKLVDSIAFLTEKLNEIPEEYRSGAEFEIEATSDGYGATGAEARITYKRPETDKEMATRQATARRQSKAAEEREKAVLAALKAKYKE